MRGAGGHAKIRRGGEKKIRSAAASRREQKTVFMTSTSRSRLLPKGKGGGKEEIADVAAGKKRGEKRNLDA